MIFFLMDVDTFYEWSVYSDCVALLYTGLYSRVTCKDSLLFSLNTSKM